MGCVGDITECFKLLMLLRLGGTPRPTMQKTRIQYPK